MCFFSLTNQYKISTTHPEFNKEKCVLWAFLVKLFQAAFLLRELVVDLPDVHSFEQRVTVGGVGLSNVNKQVFAVLQLTDREETKNEHEPQHFGKNNRCLQCGKAFAPSSGIPYTWHLPFFFLPPEKNKW